MLSFKLLHTEYALGPVGCRYTGLPHLRHHHPVIFCAQVQTALGAVLRDARAKGLPCGVFGSFGWSGEAVDELDSRLRVSVLPQMSLQGANFSGDHAPHWVLQARQELFPPSCTI